MTNLSFNAKGCFPLYFREPDKVAPIFDRLGFSKGFKREHSSGLTFYIHRAKNKKEMAPIGITVPLLVENTKEFIDSLNDLPITIEAIQWLEHTAYLLILPEQKQLLIIQKDHLLPSKIEYHAKQSSSALYGNGTFILNTRNPNKTADWYEAFLECETVYRSDSLTISVMTNKDEKIPGLTVFHILEKNSKKIGPLQYKNFCLTTKNIYECWRYMLDKKKIDPHWKNPQEDGYYRTILFTGPDGYCWKVYGEVPFHSITEASKLLKQPKAEILLSIQKELLPSLEIKFVKNIPDNARDTHYICEDHLLQHLWQSSPYLTKLTFSK